jgi:hypothetical protein
VDGDQAVEPGDLDAVLTATRAPKSTKATKIDARVSAVRIFLRVRLRQTR